MVTGGYDPITLAMFNRGMLAQEPEVAPQVAWCHAECLRSRLHTSFPAAIIDPDIYPPEGDPYPFEADC